MHDGKESQEANSEHIINTPCYTSPYKVFAMANRVTTRSTSGFLLVITTAALTAQAFSTSDTAVQSQTRRIQTQCQPWRPSSQSHRIVGPKYSSSSSLHQTRRPGNPITGLFSDMASSISSSLSSGGKASFNVEALDQKLNAVIDQASWDDIRSKLDGQQTEEEKAFRSNVEKGLGKASPLNKVRLFDESNNESDIRVTFFRDHASWCPYCQKVWLTLEEKQIPYRIEKVNMRCYGDKTREFLNLQPSGAIPVAIIDGETYNQSNDIIFELEEKFPNHKQLLPEDPMERQNAQRLLSLERALFSSWMYWLTGSNTPGRKKTFIDTLTEVEQALESSPGGDFFLGKEVSLVDFMFAPFLERMTASMIYFKGYPIRVVKGEKTDFPAVNRWFDAMETLESYQLTKGDFYSHCWDLPPQLGGCSYDTPSEPYVKAINGERTMDGKRGSWDLPLEAHNQGVEPDWDFLGQDEAASKREAVERITFNYNAIVRFAARGAGNRGMPPFSAPLSDPNAVPAESVIGSVETILKILSTKMLDGVDNEKISSQMKEIANLIRSEGGEEHRDNVIASLAYLRDRIGVPRDMRLPAARQLRAHLNWSIGTLLEA